jgi:putative hemolysin
MHEIWAWSLFASEAPSNLPLGVGLALIPVLIIINGFFVAAEFAVVAVRKSRVEELVNQGVPRAKSLMSAITDLDRSVAASQLGITIASLALGLVSEPALHQLVEPLLANAPTTWQGVVTHLISVGLTLSLITYMHVVFGEQMPKIAALQSAEKIGLWVAFPLNLLARCTMPVIRLMNGSSMFFLKRLGFKPDSEEGEVHSVDELRILIEESEEAGLIEPEAADYVINVFELSNKKVGDVMVPWGKVAALEVHTPSDRVMEAVREGAHTRMPIYDGDPDNVIGIVNTKDLFYLFSLGGVVLLHDAIYPAQFLGPDQPVSTALRLFRKSHRPMAIIRAPDGKVVGILTLEDVLEEIVGDIEDEHDDHSTRSRYLRTMNRRRTGNRG